MRFSNPPTRPTNPSTWPRTSSSTATASALPWSNSTPSWAAPSRTLPSTALDPTSKAPSQTIRFGWWRASARSSWSSRRALPVTTRTTGTGRKANRRCWRSRRKGEVGRI
uniref:(northern house mosquito) hypothetical protein n=1 Tax=Culex pipiens TaxID=7175 RepID=A0A8D7ZU92_CULPI